MSTTRREFLAGTSCLSVGVLSALSQAGEEAKAPSLPKA